MGDLGDGFTVDEALSSMGFGYFHVVALFYAGLGWASNAMALTLLSIIGPAVKSEWGLSSNQESMITTVVFAGTLVGAYFFGYVSDAYGRRISSVCMITCIGGAVLVSGFSPTYEFLLLVISLFGFGAGGGHVFASWFLEFAPISTRGSATAALSLFYSFGNIIAASLAWIIMPRLGWRWLLASSCLPPLFVLLLGLIVPESPRYLIMKGKITDAQKVLEKVALLNRTKLPRGSLISSLLIGKDEKHVSSEESQLLHARKQTDGGSESCLSSVFLLVSPKLLRTTFLLWLVYFGNIFAYYGIIFLTTEMSGGQSNCTSHIVVINDQDTTSGTSYGEILLNSLAEFPSALFAAVVVDWAGRKLSLIMTSTLSFILLVPLVFQQSEIVTTMLLFGGRLFITSGTMVLAVYSSEMGDVNLEFTLDEALSSIGFGYFHVAALFFAGLGWASNAMGLTLLSIIGPAVKTEFGISSGEEGMLTSVVFVGTIMGAYVFGYISDAYGRRTSSICTIVSTGGALCLASLSPNYHSLLLGLALFGCGAGGAHVFASWFLEFAPTCSRGSWTVAISFFFSIGNIFAAFLAMVCV